MKKPIFGLDLGLKSFLDHWSQVKLKALLSISINTDNYLSARLKCGTICERMVGKKILWGFVE